MECCLPDRAWRACESCRVIGSSCKSAWIALRQSCTTFIEGPAHGRAHEKVFGGLVPKVFECDWQPPFRAMPKLKSFVNSSTRRRSRQKTGSYAGSRCVVLPGAVSP